jgi:hypothetical protein
MPDSVLRKAPPEAQVLEQVDRILASELFQRSGRLSKLFRFVCEQTIRDHADRLKEYNLGIEVFDRDAGYDPRTDPIVRVEAGRLRSKLNEYYIEEGSADPIVIGLPRGGYAITFQCRRPARTGVPGQSPEASSC